jgi:hydrogenase-4 component B
MASSMWPILAAIGVLLLGGSLSLALGSRRRMALFCGAGSAVLALVVGCLPTLHCLLTGENLPALELPWPVPLAGADRLTLSVALDPLSSFFVLGALLHGALSGMAGSQYLLWRQGARPVGVAYFAFHLTIAAMVVVAIARNALLFLVAWELMAIASYFLVTYEDEREEVRAAGRVYLIATHLGAAFLLAFFAILGRHAGSFDFAAISAAREMDGATADLLFLLAVVGFGAKAGFMPLHVWLPDAYAAAPGFVSSVLSGVMSKFGIYGLVRAFFWLPAPPAWWGWLLILVGMVSGVWGILLALSQRDLKRLLAYSSIENLGVIAVGLGAGLLAQSAGMRTLAVLSFAGTLLHVVNHGVFKSLLFLGAGAVRQATGTLDLEQLGGLAKRMPWVSLCFLTGCVAISGLPPFNGFVSEFFIYMGVFQTELATHAASSNPLAAESGLGVIAELSLITGFTAACFSKAYCVCFLGEPRSDAPQHAIAPNWLLGLPMGVLAIGCLALALAAPWVVKSLEPILQELTGFSVPAVQTELVKATDPLQWVLKTALTLIALTGALAFLRHRLLARRQVGVTGTWDCGYARPTPRIQYTGSSFVQPMTSFFALLVRQRPTVTPPSGFFPPEASFRSHTPDVIRAQVYDRAFAGVTAALGKLRWLQHGRVHLYVLYIALTALGLLVWRLVRN